MPSGTQKPQHNVELFKIVLKQIISDVTTLNLLYVSYADLARLPNASNNMCFLNITISLYDYSLSRSTSDGYDAFSREDSDQKSQKIDVVLTVFKEAFKRSISGGKRGKTLVHCQ
uniref:Uncharacterized protein n=1 Tax=Brassica oleracea TaxID=3712 RepID=A0A3P6FP89_BRAOL|nr:unnamed protein product [Brassica oleracea]